MYIVCARVFCYYGILSEINLDEDDNDNVTVGRVRGR